jgi:hypothetical protein
MRAELRSYFEKKKLKEFYDDVYIGNFDEKASTKVMDVNEMISALRKDRQLFEEGFPRFCKENFEKTWGSLADQFASGIKKACGEGIFINSKSFEALNKLPVIQKANSF